MEVESLHGLHDFKRNQEKEESNHLSGLYCFGIPTPSINSTLDEDECDMSRDYAAF